jgi:hypothetical protein
MLRDEHVVLAFVVSFIAACTGASTASEPFPPETVGATPSAPPTTTSAVRGRSLFCAYGGVGMTPDPLPPGYETEFAVMVVELDNPGPAIEGVSVVGASLADGVEATTASLRRVDHVVVMPALATPGPTLGTFAIYLNPEGTPFSGRLEPGRTVLRVRFSLDNALAGVPTRCRLELGGLGAAPLVVQGGVDGSWPT